LSSNALLRFPELFFFAARNTSRWQVIHDAPDVVVSAQISVLWLHNAMRACIDNGARIATSASTRAMSYDTTINDALDPPQAHMPQRASRAAQRWRVAIIVIGALFAFVLTLGGWLLLR
jgi:hypothetical protein